MSVLLFILKLLGILLLVLFSILLLLVLVALTVPVRYRGEAKKYETFSGRASISWLFRLLQIEVTFTPEPVVAIKLFGRPFGAKRDEKEEAYDLQAAESPAEGPEPKTAEAPVSVSEAVNVRPEPETRPTAPLLDKPKARPFREAPPQEAKGAGEVRRVKLSDIEETPLQEPSEDGETPDKEIPTEKLDFAYFKKMPMAEKKELIRLIFRFLKRILKHIRPRDFLLKGIIGTGDPETTGYVLAGCGILKGLLGEHLQVQGDFRQPILEGEVSLRGRIRFGALLAALVQLAWQKPVRKLIIMAWKGKGDKNGR